MGWVESSKFFCNFSETLTVVANALIHTLILVPGYGAIAKIPEIETCLPHTLDGLTHIECYMDDAITAVQGTKQQRQVFDGTARALKWLFPYLPGETKDSESTKKLLAGGG